MSELRTIKVTETVKAELDTIRLDKETYNLLIQRLLRENQDLRQDKENLMKIAMKTEDSIAFPNVNHSVFFAIVEVLKDNAYSDDEKLAFMKIYLRPSIQADKEAVLSMIEAIKSDYGFSEDFANPKLLDNLSSWIRESYP